MSHLKVTKQLKQLMEESGAGSVPIIPDVGGPKTYGSRTLGCVNKF
jgi:hypothetical protein